MEYVHLLLLVMIFSIKDSRCINNKWRFIRFMIFITPISQHLQEALQNYKNLYFQILFYDIHVCFLFKTIQATKITIFYCCYSCYECREMFHWKIMSSFSFGIIKIVTSFARLQFCFQKQGPYIFSFLECKRLRAISRLFSSKFFLLFFSNR